MPSEEFLQNLNENQLAAVKATEGYVRVAAGAGSGKTRVLTARYVYIAKALGVAPEHILSVTFTNKAAREMRKRIRAYMPDEDGGWILTFHSACHKILKEEIHLLAYPQNFMVMDEEDQKSVLQRIYTQNGLTLKDFPFRKCLAEIEIYKSKFDYVPFLTDPARPAQAPGLTQAQDKRSMDLVISEYLKQQRAHFWLDFADLIQFTLYLFKTSKKTLQKWQTKFEYIQIDEFQDVSGEQYKLARLLAGKHKNLFIVGDPDQTIYSWRGADVSFFNNFEKFFANAKTVILDINYRSTPEILAASNNLIAKNPDRTEKTLKAVLPSGEKPHYFHARSKAEESEAIADKIAALQKEGVPATDIAVLYRSNHMSRALETALIKKGVPYVVFGGTAFYQRKEIKDALAYLRLAVFKDDLSFDRVINTPPRGIGRTRLAFLHTYAENNGISLLEALSDLAQTPQFKGTGAADFLLLAKQAETAAAHQDPQDALDFVLQNSGYEEYLRLSGSQDRLDNLAELKSSVTEWEQAESANVSAADYLNSISLLTNADAQDKKDCVKLMTVHTAKGLEFPHVFICCLNEGHFPSRKIKSKMEMEEERRVAYVAITRAQKNLYLSDAEGFEAQTGGVLYTSRFIFDIGAEHLKCSGKFSQGHLARSESYIAESERKMGIRAADPPKMLLHKGSRVYHPVFGLGEVTEVSVEEYVVRFENGKTRSIAANTAVLSAI